MSEISNLLGMMLVGQAAALNDKEKLACLDEADKRRADAFEEATQELRHHIEPYRHAKNRHLKMIAEMFSEIEALIDTTRSELVRYVEQRYTEEVRPHGQRYDEKMNTAKAEWANVYKKAGEIMEYEYTGDGKYSPKAD